MRLILNKAAKRLPFKKHKIYNRFKRARFNKTQAKKHKN